MLKIPLLVSLGHHGGRRKVASLRPPFSTPLRSLGEPDPDTPFLVPIEHAPPLFVRIWEDKISLKIPPPPLRSAKFFNFQVTFAPFVGISENRIARLPRYPDSPNMALALHAARRPTLLFEFLDYPHQSLNFLFLESFVVQPQLRIGGSIGIQRDQSKAYLPLSTS